MSIVSSRRRARFLVFIAAVFWLAGCARRADTLSELSAGFKKDRDLRSLSLMLSHLKLGTSQAEIEKILGKPDYSPIEGQYYYSVSDWKTEEGTPVGLIVEYRRTNYRTGETIPSGKLESLYLGPIGE